MNTLERGRPFSSGRRPQMRPGMSFGSSRDLTSMMRQEVLESGLVIWTTASTQERPSRSPSET